jgi:DNA-binding transcriptional MerR regulator
LQVSASWTIRELSREVEVRLAGEDVPVNGQVRAVPDERSIRYYTTLGLLDRPALRGRTALYGQRHLAQLIAIKRLQAEGKPLAEIQRILPTLDDAALSTLSGVELQAPRRAAGRRDFWRDTDSVAEAAPAPEAPEAAPASAPLTALLELTLGPGVRLVLQPARPATDADAAALLAAASPLLAELARRHLVEPVNSDPQPSPDSTPEDCP